MPRRPGTEKFNIRLNALDFKDLQDRVSRPITVLPHVTFHKTLLDRFIDTFKEQVEQNSRYHTEQVCDRYRYVIIAARMKMDDLTWRNKRYINFRSWNNVWAACKQRPTLN